MAQIINGRKIANEFCDQIKERVREVRTRGIFPTIALINVGDDPASRIYVGKKEKLAESVGIASTTYRLECKASEEEVSDLILELNKNEHVHAILLQSPLPKHLEFQKLVNLISPDKDVDGLTTLNQGKLFSGNPWVIPCTPLGILHLLRYIHENLAGMHAVVLGRSLIVGRPLAQLLLNSNCTVTMLHSYSRDLPTICRTADILISAVGRQSFIGGNCVKPGATVIDVGVNRVAESAKIVGDVIFDDVYAIAGAISPVPNGVGPMTVAYLMNNTLMLSSRSFLSCSSRSVG
ncbi:MAG: bifunctional methylenetetrahydrofolate dehydrogenase/methenyltetrahydrofolate cyclohydrolase [Holosporaceae bacterium]|jgi:methylenetetrahydrofolate dehydrogenase (NADP+)/methenyltetrahydrofolate cyclohydrolase|nr:bifunctional methylenetetrahydrofolate dehydrogenase/methenyltetrahydrofolate cyclohydrolase [Holosporaceae bacterium]